MDYEPSDKLISTSKHINLINDLQRLFMTIYQHLEAIHRTCIIDQCEDGISSAKCLWLRYLHLHLITKLNVV